MNARTITRATPNTPAPAAEATAEMPVKVRKPFGVRTQKLAYDQRAGFHRHWFNDVPGRIQAALDASYAHVKGHDGKPVSQVVDKLAEGGGLTAFLMEIPQELYDQDQAAKQARIDEVDRAIRRGELEGKIGHEGRYVPSQGISIK